jgi:hypothetical protein
MKRGFIIGCLVVVVACFLIGIGVFIYDLYRDARAAAQFKVLAEQIRTACNRCATTNPVSNRLYRNGRVLAVHLAGDAIGAILTEETLTNTVATSPQDIGTLVCVGDRVKQVVGHYTGGDAAYRISRDVCVIDWTSGDIIFKTTLNGSSPPAAKTRGGIDMGSDPEGYELREFIKKLVAK